MSTIAQRVVDVHRSLDAAALPHAFGGALALAWCTADPRGTSDIDVNVFVSPRSARRVVNALPYGVERDEVRLAVLRRDGQVRLRWDDTPLDLFLSTHAFHAGAAERARVEPFMGTSVPFLACADLAVFKAMFDRTQDWADLEKMAAAGTLDREWLLAQLKVLMGDGDDRLARVAALPWI